VRHIKVKKLGFLCGLGLLLLFGVGGLAPRATPGPPGEDTQQKQILRKRVEEIYTFLQVGNWARVEDYLTEESKEIFRSQAKKQIIGFEIELIKLDPDAVSATVVVRVPTITPFSTAPVSVPQSTQWRLVNGNWYAVLAKPDINALKELFDSAPAKGTTKSPPRPGPQTRALKFETPGSALGVVHSGEVKLVRFPFINAADHAVTIAQVMTGCECLRPKIEKKQYKPGESGELAIEFNPAGPEFDYEQAYTQTIVVQTDPGGGLTRLIINAHIVPRSPEASSPEGEKKP
jgi:hypothetical protein